MPAINFISPHAASITADSTWRSFDCTSLLPGGFTASGVLLRYSYNGPTSSNLVGFRRGDSTDTRTWKAFSETSGTWEYAAIGLDSADDTFDYYLSSGSASPTLQVVGFFDSTHVKFLQNGSAYTPGNGVFADVDISSATGSDTAIGGIFQIDSQRGAARLLTAWRVNGGSDNLYSAVGDSDTALNGCGMVIVEVDGSEICEWKQDSSFGGASAILVGYIVSGWTFNSPASDKSTGTTGSWESVTVTTGAVAAYVEMVHTSNTHNVAGGMSTDDSVEDTYGGLPPISPALIEVTLTDAIEQKISSTSQDLYLRATVDESGGSTTVSATADPLVLAPQALTIRLGVGAAMDLLTLSDTAASIRLAVSAGTDAVALGEQAAALRLTVQAGLDAVTIAEPAALLSLGATIVVQAGTDALVLTEGGAALRLTAQALADALVLGEQIATIGTADVATSVTASLDFYVLGQRLQWAAPGEPVHYTMNPARCHYDA